jgi:hypothetical protein
MKTWLARIGIALLAVVSLAGLTYHVALREWCLRWGTTASEVHSTMPGDDLFPVYENEATHAITIHAAPQKVWPWLMQMGQDRSGFYSYRFLENMVGCEMPKVERIVPEPQERRYGSPAPNVLAARAA